MALGFTTPPTRESEVSTDRPLATPAVNTRTSLWPTRWPAIALQSCIDSVEAAPLEQRNQVKRDLPCMTCPKNTGCLNAKSKELGSLMYDREILTSPRSGESSLFPRDLMRPMLMPSESLVPHYRKPFGVEHEYVVIQAWDIAWSEKTGGDFLVCMTALVHRVSGRRRLLDIQRWQRKTFGQQIDLIKEKHEAFASDLVVIEGDAAQQVWKQQVAETTAVPVVSHSAGDGKTSLQVGVPSLLIQFENRRWQIPFQEGSYHRDETDVFLAELEAFGWVDGHLMGVGEHDDTVMCFWHLNWGIDYFTSAGSQRNSGQQHSRGVVPGAR